MKKRRTVLIILFFIVMSSGLFAQHAEASEHHFDWLGFIGKTFNAVVLFGGLIYLLRKPMIAVLSQKTLEINTDMNRREEKLASTTRSLEEIKLRLEKIEEEVAAMKTAAEKSGLTEKSRIETLGDAEASRILEITETEITHKMENAVRNLKARIADMTIDHFKKEIGDHLDPQTHEKIIEKNIDICGDIIERK